MKKYNVQKKLPTIYPKGYLAERIKSIKENGLPKGYFTGVTNLDKIFRLDKQRLITVTGVPNCGKSEFVDFLLTTYNKRYGLKSLLYSPENQPVELHLSKLISKYTNKPLAELSSDEIDTAMNYINENFFFCNYDKVKTLDDIEKQVEHQSSSNQLDVLVIDAYNKIELEKGSNEIETEFISKILDRLCEMAIKYNIMVILVAHPRKMEWRNNDRVPQCPTAYDINGSANFYNKSDFVLAVHRDREEENETVTIRVDKVKFSNYGTQGKCYLKYDLKSGNYYNAPDLFDFDEKSEYKPIPFALPELPKKKEPLDVVVSMYSGSADNIGTDVCLKDFLLTDKHKDIVELIRTGKTSEERKEIKSKLSHKIPCVTISGKFSKRGKDYLLSSSGLMAIDIDLKDNKDIINQVPVILKTLPYVTYYGKSISGDGYFAVVPIENPNHLKQHFYAIEEEMLSLGIVVDKACKDITRLRYASYDENHYYNPDATTYYWEKDEDVKNKNVDKDRVRKTDFIPTSTMSDKEMVERQLNYLRNNHLSIADDYDTWFKTGMALYSGFGENGRGYFHEFSKLSYKYDETECNKQYDNIISHYDTNNDITLGTLIHIVNETKNKEIKTCA